MIQTKVLVTLHPEYSRLIKHVVKAIGVENVQQIINNDGIGTSLLMESETFDIYINCRAEIIAQLIQESKVSESILDCVLNTVAVDITPDLQLLACRAIGGMIKSPNIITHSLAWYGINKVCHWFSIEMVD